MYSSFYLSNSCSVIYSTYYFGALCSTRILLLVFARLNICSLFSLGLITFCSMLFILSLSIMLSPPFDMFLSALRSSLLLLLFYTGFCLNCSFGYSSTSIESSLNFLKIAIPLFTLHAHAINEIRKSCDLKNTKLAKKDCNIPWIKGDQGANLLIREVALRMVPKPGRNMLRKSDKRPAWWFESLKSFIVMHIFINEYYTF